MKAFRCPNCGGEIRYDIGKKTMSCSFCGSEITREDYTKYLNENGMYAANELVCPQCGASVLSYDDTIASFCSYCGSPVTFMQNTVEDSKPDGVVPFEVTREAAERLYDKRLNEAAIGPEWLRDKGDCKLVGIYMPYYVYDARAHAHVKTTGQESTVHGDRTTVKEYEMEFDVDNSYEGTRFDAAKAFPDSLSESVDTFDPTQAKEFDVTYLAGFYADGGNVKEEAYRGIVEKLVESDVHSGFKYGSVSVKANTAATETEIKAKKVLFPVWLATHKKGDRVCYAAINGQNGNVAAEIPIDRWKYLKLSVIVAAVLAVILNLIFTIRPDIFMWISAGILLLFGITLAKFARNVYVREHHLDDIGLIGEKKFYESASASGGKWKFRVPASVTFKAWWKTLLGLLLFAAVIGSGTVEDIWFYGAAAANIALAVWSAIDLIKQQNLLSSRDIPVFSMKRGGDENG
ncbi:MAG: zinc ribbon domain-containing protein [Clostridia bacterium]|nr:zinc ribbon domain-containing protein [Clostridia bacterium]